MQIVKAFARRDRRWKEKRLASSDAAFTTFKLLLRSETWKDEVNQTKLERV